MPTEQANEQQGLSLRDALTSAFAQQRETEANDNDVPLTQSTPATAPLRETPANAAENAVARARDDAGRFAKTEKMAPATAPTQAPQNPIPAQQTISATPTQPIPAAVAPPSSWRKDRHEAFTKLDPETQQYILQREREFATGVSTYKSEAERSRTLQSALEPFLPELQRHNIAPEQWITNLGHAHQMLALGSPQQKTQMFWQLAQDYGIDLSQLGVQGAPQQTQDPNFQWVQQQLHATKSQLDALVAQQQRQHQIAEQQQQNSIEQMIEEFRADTANYPHFETVRETMAGLLQSGLAQDLKSAYGMAIRHHDDLWQAQQAEQQKSAESERQRLAAEAAAKARGKVVSVKSATPSGQNPAPSDAKGRRAQLQDAYSAIGGSRV